LHCGEKISGSAARGEIDEKITVPDLPVSPKFAGTVGDSVSHSNPRQVETKSVLQGSDKTGDLKSAAVHGLNDDDNSNSIDDFEKIAEHFKSELI
jgi:hypothetical protein